MKANKAAQMGAMKKLLSKGKKATSGPGVYQGAVAKERGAKNPKGDAMKKIGKSPTYKY